MTEKPAVPDPIQNVPEESEPEFFDFTSVTPRTKNMHDPRMILEPGSNKGEFSALAAELAAIINVENRVGVQGPTLMDIARVRAGSKDLIAFPTKARGPATITVTWPDNDTGARLDLQLLLQLYPVSIPKGHRAIVPVTTGTSKKYGKGLVLKFSEMTFARITKSTKKSDDSSSETTTKKSRKKSKSSGESAQAAQPQSGAQPQTESAAPDQKGA